MKEALKFLLALAITTVIMLAVRALFIEIYAVRNTLAPSPLMGGDRVLVNRWSYGLRAGDNVLVPYSRWFADSIRRGDLVAFNPPADTVRPAFLRDVFIARVKALPGDTVAIGKERFVIPVGNKECNHHGKKLFLLEADKPQNRWIVPESNIIGRVFLIVYSTNAGGRWPWNYRKNRWLCTIQ